MKVKVVTQQINQVREGKSDFTSLIDLIHSQAADKKKVVPINTVKRARELSQDLEQIT